MIFGKHCADPACVTTVLVYFGTYLVVLTYSVLGNLVLPVRVRWEINTPLYEVDDGMRPKKTCERFDGGKHPKSSS